MLDEEDTHKKKKPFKPQNQYILHMFRCLRIYIDFIIYQRMKDRVKKTKLIFQSV